MDIDWFTTIAQIINFLVLVYLLKRFLYQPVITAMNRRQQRIRDRLEEAEKSQAEAEREAEDYRARQSELEEQRSEVLESARQEADKKREEMIEQAREEAEARRREWREALESEQAEFHRQLRGRMASMLARVVRKSLADLADRQLESGMVSAFSRRLEELGEEDRQGLERRLREADQVRVASRGELAAEQRDQVSDALASVLGWTGTPDFITDDQITAGIELRVGDYRLGWTVDDYVSGLEIDMHSLTEAGGMDTESVGERA